MEQVTGQATEPIPGAIQINSMMQFATQAVQHLKTTLSQSLEQTVGGATQVSDQALQRVTEKALDAQQQWNGVVERVSNGVSTLTGQATHAIANTAAHTKSSASQLGTTFTTGPRHAVETLIQQWMQEHPLLAWFLTHPLITLGVLLVALVVLRRLLGVTVQLTETLLLTILRSPWLLGRWLVSVATGFFNRPVTMLVESQVSQQQRLAALLERLEAIKQEQDALIQEVRALLNSGQ